MQNILKKESILYGIGHILSRLVSFLLLPIFTNLLTPYDYGIISLVYAFIGFFTVVLHFGLDTSLLRHYKPANNKDRIQFVTNAYLPILCVNCIFLCICFLGKNFLSSYLMGGEFVLLFIMVILILFFDVLWSIPMILLRADNKPITFIALNLINVLSNIVFVYCFVIYSHWQVFGVILSNLLSSALLFVITFFIIIQKISISTIDFSVFKKIFKFGSPFVFAGIFSMIIELSDRYIIKYLLDFDSLGIYNAGYKLGMLMLLVVMGFNMAWQPFFLDKKNKDNKILISDISNNVFLLFSFIACGIILFVEPLSQIKIFNFKIIGTEFIESISIVSWICIGYLFHGAYLLQLPGPYLTNNTLMIAIIRGVGALVNIILNFQLIPILGIDGAAIATCLSFLMMAILIFLYNKKIYPINYNVYAVCCSIVAILIVVLISKTNPHIIMRLVTFITIPCFIFLMGGFNDNDVKKWKAKVNGIISK